MAEFYVSYSLTTPAGNVTFNDGTIPYYRISAVNGLDGGSPRVSVEDVPARDGGIVSGGHLSAAYPVIEGDIVHGTSLTTRREKEDYLRKCLYSLRQAEGTLSWLPSGSGLRRQRAVRLYERPTISGGMIKRFQFALVSPDPLAYSETLQSIDSSALFAAGMLGPSSFFWLFSEAGGGTALVTPGGDEATFPTVTIYGPGSAFTVANLTTGKSVNLTAAGGLTLATGETATIDMRRESIIRNGDASLTLDKYLSAATSEFFSLSPGVQNTVRLQATGATGATHLAVAWRDAYSG